MLETCAEEKVVGCQDGSSTIELAGAKLNVNLAAEVCVRRQDGLATL